MNTASVTLDDMLDARENRAALQRQLIEKYGLPLLCFTMNIPGSIKNSPLIRYAFAAGEEAAIESLCGSVVHRESSIKNTGCESFIIAGLSSEHIKSKAIEIEERAEIGRLYDMDVLDISGEKLSRPIQRRCIICGGPASACARSRAHGLDKLQERVKEILTDFAAADLGKKAADALIAEARFTPKPGLVDSANNGAHKDMDLALMERSANVLRPWFERFVMAGIDGAPAEEYRRIGIQAERSMMEAAGGVNTHRGAIYSMGLMLSAYGLCLGEHSEDIIETAAALAKELYKSAAVGLSHGNYVREKYNAGGAQREAMAGFPNAVRCLRNMKRGRLYALLRLIAETEDSNVLYRAGREGAAFLRQQAALISDAPADNRYAMTLELDEECIRRNISPGGCADLFALALFMETSLPWL